jgi:5-(carboxyamino)imidazole ribonucleotide mutase
LAIQILSVKYPDLREKMKGYKKKMEEEVVKKDQAFRERR